MHMDVRDSLYVYMCVHINRERERASQRQEEKENVKSGELILALDTIHVHIDRHLIHLQTYGPKKHMVSRKL